MQTPNVGDYVIIKSSGMKAKIIGVSADKWGVSYKVEYSFGGYKTNEMFFSSKEIEVLPKFEKSIEKSVN
jgi:hypothetical protein